MADFSYLIGSLVQGGVALFVVRMIQPTIKDIQASLASIMESNHKIAMGVEALLHPGENGTKLSHYKKKKNWESGV